MKYRLQIDISFKDEQNAKMIMNFIEAIKNKVYKPIGNEIIEYFRKCEYHQCFHDEIPPKPCKNYISIDFNKE